VFDLSLGVSLAGNILGSTLTLAGILIVVIVYLLSIYIGRSSDKVRLPLILLMVFVVISMVISFVTSFLSFLYLGSPDCGCLESHIAYLFCATIFATIAVVIVVITWILIKARKA